MIKTIFKSNHRLLLLLSSVLLSSLFSFSQPGSSFYKGKVLDENGNPLQAVTVTVKGTSNGTSTAKDGSFSINIPRNNAVLVFSYIGYTQQEVSADNKNAIAVKLQPDMAALNQVVVVGYGTQKKANLTGSVDQVGAEVFRDRPVSNTTHALQGVIPNLNIRITDGKPTRSAEYNVRGVTSIGAGGSALVLIDGVQGNPDLLNPGDIESVTVLKDAASAAIYGARGSFGVVLITTKAAGKDKTSVNYSSGYSMNYHTKRADLQNDGYLWGQVFNDAFRSNNDYTADPQKANSVFPWSQQYLAELKRRYEAGIAPSAEIDPATGKYTYYGSTDWLKELYADQTPSMDQQISISGAGSKSSFYISGRYNNQGSIYRYSGDKYNMYNLRAKGSIEVAPWLKLENDITFNQMDYTMPITSGSTPVLRRLTDESFPVAMLFNPDGTITDNGAIVLGSFVTGSNSLTDGRSQTRNTTRASSQFFGNKLKINADFTIDKGTFNRSQLNTYVPYSTGPGTFLERGASKLNNSRDESLYTALNAYATYTQTLGKHSFSGLLGYNYERSVVKSEFVERDNLINANLPDFTLIDGLNFILRGGGNEWKTAGGFFRGTYSFASRYLFEVNGRYDGSSKFPTGQQFGIFPSVSAGWRVSEENFWKKGMDKVVNNFKFRASYGSLGNGNIDPYQFLQTMGVSRSALVINGIRPNYTQLPNVIPDGLTWERATTTNFGADVEMLRSRLTLNFDWYTRKTTDMFTGGLPLPATFGASVPKGNYADLSTKGWELSISWRNRTHSRKPLSYDFRFTLADSRSVIDRFNNPLNVLSTYYVGQEVGAIWGYVTEGYFTDQKDIDNHAKQTFIPVSTANKPLPGDIKFKDLNGDNVINQGTNTLNNPGDRKVIGNSSLRYQFGFNSNFDWNNFSLGMFFQGVGKRDFAPGSENTLFWGAYGRPYGFHPKFVDNNMWSEQNPDAYFPRLRGYAALSSGYELNVAQTKYLQNAAYVRMKQVTFGYNIPPKLFHKVKFTSLRVFFTGQNLFTWSPMFKTNPNMDPENIERADPEQNSGSGQGFAYPILKTYSFGLSLGL